MDLGSLRIIKYGEAMRVLIGYSYASNNRDAVANAINDLAKGLSEAGVQTVVYKQYDPYQERSQPVPGTIAESFRKVNRLKGQLLYLAGFTLHLIRTASTIDCVITLDTPSGLAFTGKLAKLVSRGRIKHVAWIMDLYRLQSRNQENSPSSRLRDARLKFETATIKSADKVVVLGECMQVELRRNGISESVVLPIWHNASSTLPIPKPEAKAAYYRSSDFIVMYSGNAGVAHPLDGLVRAAEILKNEKQIRFIVSGHGKSYDSAQKLARQAGLENIEFTSGVPFHELSLYLSSADIHVVCLSEQALGSCVPSKAYGAMAAARPILFLGSAGCQVALDVDEAQCGYCIPTDEAEKIANTIFSLYRQPSLTDQMGRNSRLYFEDQRTLATGVTRWSQMLRTVID
ncbi:glycosyltransferase family 4 protein [Rhodococcus sp. AW25M09]|uniref:glycosyltransferase family 4 protein n=1 Tax=Rhodococcus sp. AW25M09 TaxID=1268303 RepID=UPI00034DE08C|nr:glycosyltransferase family 4 protein [Rhodococcus sp. AW25M09]